MAILSSSTLHSLRMSEHYALIRKSERAIYNRSLLSTCEYIHQPIKNGVTKYQSNEPIGREQA